MANPRLKVGFDDVGAEHASYLIDADTITYSAASAGGSAGVGLAVEISSDGVVALLADDGRLHGKLIGVEPDGVCTVQVRGYMTLPAGTGASVTLGKRVIGDLLSSAKGYIKEMPAASSHDDAYINKLVKAVGEIVDNDDTDAVVILL